MTALQTAQHTEVAPTGYSKRFRHPEHTSWLCAPDDQHRHKLFQQLIITNRTKEAQLCTNEKP